MDRHDITKNFPHGFLVINARSGETLLRTYDWKAAFYTMKDVYNVLVTPDERYQPWQSMNLRTQFYTYCLYLDSDNDCFSIENMTGDVCIAIIILDRI